MKLKRFLLRYYPPGETVTYHTISMCCCRTLFFKDTCAQQNNCYCTTRTAVLLTRENIIVRSSICGIAAGLCLSSTQAVLWRLDNTIGYFCVAKTRIKTPMWPRNRRASQSVTPVEGLKSYCCIKVCYVCIMAVVYDLGLEHWNSTDKNSGLRLMRAPTYYRERQCSSMRDSVFTFPIYQVLCCPRDPHIALLSPAVCYRAFFFFRCSFFVFFPAFVCAGIILEYELRDRSRQMKEIDLLHLSPE